MLNRYLFRDASGMFYVAVGIRICHSYSSVNTPSHTLLTYLISLTQQRRELLRTRKHEAYATQCKTVSESLSNLAALMSK